MRTEGQLTEQDRKNLSEFLDMLLRRHGDGALTSTMAKAELLLLVKALEHGDMFEVRCLIEEGRPQPIAAF